MTCYPFKLTKPSLRTRGQRLEIKDQRSIPAARAQGRWRGRGEAAGNAQVRVLHVPDFVITRQSEFNLICFIVLLDLTKDQLLMFIVPDSLYEKCETSMIMGEISAKMITHFYPSCEFLVISFLNRD